MHVKYFKYFKTGIRICTLYNSFNFFDLGKKLIKMYKEKTKKFKIQLKKAKTF